jgi:hypothetical protein
LTGSESSRAAGSERLCACGCGESLEGKRPNARYRSDACRSRGWKGRAGYTDPRAAKPRRNGQRKAKRKPDLRISYRKALDALEEAFAQYGVDSPYVRARAVLRPLLSDAARREVAVTDLDVAAAVLVALDGAREDAPEGDLAQLRADAAIGRALREAAHLRDDTPLMHVCFLTPAGRMSGRYLGDRTLAADRRELAEAAHALLERLAPEDPPTEDTE